MLMAGAATVEAGGWLVTAVVYGGAVVPIGTVLVLVAGGVVLPVVGVVVEAAAVWPVHQL
jgi:hypothetical protein